MPHPIQGGGGALAAEELTKLTPANATSSASIFSSVKLESRGIMDVYYSSIFCVRVCLCVFVRERSGNAPIHRQCVQRPVEDD